MRFVLLLVLILSLMTTHLTARGDDWPVDRSAYKPECGVAIAQQGSRLRVRWPIAEGEQGELLLELRAGQTLFEAIGVAATADGPATPIMH